MSSTETTILNDQEIVKKLRITPRHLRDLREDSKTSDPIPSIRLGRLYRYPWGSPEMEAWLQRRANSKPTSRRRSKKAQ